jgi:polyisoprenoid-binding protein YceI
MPLQSRSAIALLPCLLAAALGAEAQTRWTVDSKASLAWWQINPHLNHLWATTCPQEPSWRPGDGRSTGWIIGQIRTPKQGTAAVYDTTIVPLNQRVTVRAVCTEAVTGRVLVGDTVAWHGVRGEVAVRGEALITGEERRDAVAREAVLQTSRYPEIRFTVDSLVNVTRQGDTLRGTAVGMFMLRDVSKPMTAAVRAWPEAGTLRVLAKLRLSAQKLPAEFGLSRIALGMGVTSGIWYDLFLGIDVVLKPEGGPES